MRCLILAAGYATRLYPLTENFPKPLLKVREKTILDWLLEDLDASGAVDGYVVITNHRFVHHFRCWADGHDLPVTVLDDGTESNETRLGAVWDIQFAIERLGLVEDLLIIAGDNLLDFSLRGFIAYQREKNTTCVMRYHEPSIAKLHKTGVAVVDADDRILEMEEKPAQPKSHWCTPPFYIFRAEDVPLIKTGIASGCGTDAPGSLIAWLCAQTPVHAYEMPGKRYDIGDLASYEEVRRTYNGVIKTPPLQHGGVNQAYR